MANKAGKSAKNPREAENDPEITDNISRYAKIIEAVFQRYWRKGETDFTFERGELEHVCKRLKIDVPKNLGDVIYTFRYRKALPKSITMTQPPDRGWLILGDGDARYRFRLNKLTHIRPANGLLVRKIPDATPEIITRYALTDEQALLAKVRYNRLIDIFLGITAYSLQNHLLSRIPNYGQIEIDELYVGLDSRGAQYIVPVQAKSGRDILGAIQTIQDVTFGALVVQNYSENTRFGERDREILKFVSQQLAAAIEHKRYEEALRRSEARSRSLILSAAFGICRCTLGGRFLDVNPALITMLGHESVEDLLALNARRDVFVSPEELDRLAEDYHCTGSRDGVEVQWKRKEGRVIVVRLSGCAATFSDEPEEVLELIAEDITDRRRLRRAASPGTKDGCGGAARRRRRTRL